MLDFFRLKFEVKVLNYGIWRNNISTPTEKVAFNLTVISKIEEFFFQYGLQFNK